MFEGEKVIQDLHYRPVEQGGDVENERKVIFDLYCTGIDGEHFIIEMQQLYQDFFKDRTVFYTSRLINKLIPRGYKGNTYELPEVYFIGILEFELGETEPGKYFYDVALCDKQSSRVFYEKLGYKLLVLPNFNKNEVDIKTDMDMWLYLLKNMSKLDKIPDFLDKRVFGLIFDIGEVAKLTPEDKMAYEASLKHKRDAENTYSTAQRLGHDRGLKEGLKKGIAQGQHQNAIETALKFKNMGLPLEQIAEGTGLTVDEIEKLK
ncbi:MULTISPECIES: Rpn family recombination-promoting nuclease/putative transposase [Sphingobacterium]|uniref:Rpn family recombination-promoting nuclease/putative transposase n=1 Tax=Sphingobacterium TaxID=28453 RepID=UPI000A07D3F3|nr:MULTISPECIES: Rpn family recombination-promoting nuclease/putative transposase [Sphingobacterium]